jgi:hypothetical protein
VQHFASRDGFLTLNCTCTANGPHAGSIVLYTVHGFASFGMVDEAEGRVLFSTLPSHLTPRDIGQLKQFMGDLTQPNLSSLALHQVSL